MFSYVAPRVRNVELVSIPPFMWRETLIKVQARWLMLHLGIGTVICKSKDALFKQICESRNCSRQCTIARVIMEVELGDIWHAHV